MPAERDRQRRDTVGVRHIGVFSDLHADGHAMDVLWAAMQRERVDGVWCLGDFCSGGAEPVRCFDEVLDRCEVVLAGNHELFVVRRVFERLDDDWASAARFAHAELGSDRRKVLVRLRSSGVAAGIVCVHGTPRKPAGGFLSSRQAAAEVIAGLDGRILLFGHTHDAAWWAPHRSRGAALRDIEPGHPHSVAPGSLLNPGAANDPGGVRWMSLELPDGGHTAGRPLRVRWHREPAS
jgi:predicted phosphodiesterase